MAKYCLIGEKLTHSLSPDIHKLLGYDYDLVELKECEVEKFVKNNDYDGFNVTIPYKKSIIPYLDQVEDRALEIGAVNTVVKKDGKLLGYNTDILGLEYALNSCGLDLQDRHVMILGTGGTSLTAQYLAKSKGAKSITVVSRKGDINYSNYTEKADTEIIINTTPVGLFPKIEEKLVTVDAFPNLIGGFDAIYNPLSTQFIIDLKRGGKIYQNGLKMLVAQAKFAKDIFFEEGGGKGVIEEIYQTILKKFENIVLIGMPACGKSTIGKALGQRLNREFIDTDEEIVRKEGVTIPEIFEKSGEKSFREIEKEVIKDQTAKRGVVIALGGGGIVDQDNWTSAQRNGIIVYIERELSLLTGEGRPLSKSPEAIKELYRIRKPIYESRGEIVVQNEGEISQVVDRIVEEFYESSRN